jgi:two-component system nitrate/nitrite response regulator NarL
MIRVAIADDHQTLIDGISLRFDGNKSIDLVFSANNGKDLLEQLKITPVDLVITDLKMPKMDGVSLARQIKRDFKNVKVIVLSMFDQPDVINKMIVVDVDGYILKTSAIEELVTAIGEVNKGKKYFDKHLHGLTSLSKVNSTSSKTNLSNTEKDILNLIAEGKTSQEIADERACAISTIHTHRRNMAYKLELCGKGELLRYAMDKKYNFE